MEVTWLSKVAEVPFNVPGPIKWLLVSQEHEAWSGFLKRLLGVRCAMRIFCLLVKCLFVTTSVRSLDLFLCQNMPPC